MNDNVLGSATSLYLRQHADNPVHWQPWSDAALAAAKASDTPILLSIGYSACHWCHVMAHESFEDEETAAVMNRLFVNIKVDREERPDLDRVYQIAHQMLTGRGGGWPLTVFLDPQDLTPFFAGTYFPPAARHGMPPFREVLARVREWFDTKRDDVRDQNGRLRRAIESLGGGDEAGEPDEAALDHAARTIPRNHDAVNGGFGGAPKFPQAPLLSLVQKLAAGPRDPDGVLDELLVFTLRRLAVSGLRDHLDGGFFRYCVDADWTIPHFEKMLYDNAQLLPIYAETAARTGEALLREAAEGIAAWLEEEMRRDGDGYSASIDADADGHEGGFHTWTPDQVHAVLGDDDAALFSRAYGLDAPPNFEGHAWHLVRRRDDAALAGDAASPEDVARRLAAARAALREARSARVPPARDDKRLAAWNALAVEGLARAGLALGRDDWVERAFETLAFIRRELWKDGRLLAVHADGRSHTPAFLDDHAMLLAASLAALRCRWDDAVFDFARAMADALVSRFSAEGGGFHFTAEGAEAPLGRLRLMSDDATPGGNGLAALALIEFGHLAGEPAWLDAAGATLRAGAEDLARMPMSHATLLRALEAWVSPPALVVVRGADRDEVARWRDAARAVDRVHCYPVHDGSARLAAPAGREDGAVTASVCHGQRCLPPVSTVEALEAQLRSGD